MWVKFPPHHRVTAPLANPGLGASVAGRQGAFAGATTAVSHQLPSPKPYKENANGFW